MNEKISRKTIAFVLAAAITSFCIAYTGFVFDKASEKTLQILQFVFPVVAFFLPIAVSIVVVKMQDKYSRNDVIMAHELSRDVIKKELFFVIETVQFYCGNVLICLYKYCGNNFEDVINEYYDEIKINVIIKNLNEIAPHRVCVAPHENFSAYVRLANDFNSEMKEYMSLKESYDKRKITNLFLDGIAAPTVNDHGLAVIVIRGIYERMARKYELLSKDSFI